MLALLEDARHTIDTRGVSITPERFGIAFWHKMEGEELTEDTNTHGVCLIGAGLLGRAYKVIKADNTRAFSIEDAALRAYYPHLCADCISAGFAHSNLGHEEYRRDRRHELMYQMAYNFRSVFGVAETFEDE